MRDDRNAPRVIVGVAGSVSGLRALRLAVAEARRRDAVVDAVRAWSLGGALRRWFAGESQSEARAERAECAAREAVRCAVAEGLGGTPPDVRINIVPIYGRADQALVEHADRDGDVIFVGHQPRRGLGRLLHRSVAGYCVTHATCPVEVVPPDAFAREASGSSGARALRRGVARLGG